MHLKVFGHKIKVKHKKLKDLNGEFDYKTNEITIDPEVKGDDYKVTLVHELFHAVLYRCSVNHQISDDLEEIIVDLLAKSVVENFDI